MNRTKNPHGIRAAAIVAACAIGIGLAGCEQDIASPLTPSGTSSSAPTASGTASATAPVAAWPEPNASTPNAEPAISKATLLTLIGSLPDENIELYGIDPEGVKLRVGDLEQEFDWLYMTPRGIEPALKLADYDGDGQNELAVDLYIGSGTGVAVEELHIVELSDDHLIDRALAPDDYVAQVNANVSFKTRRAKSGELFADLRIGEKTVPISLQAYQDDEERGRILDRLAFGSIVSFELDGERPLIRFGVGFFSENFASPEYIGNLYADVAYREDGTFELSNYRYEADDLPG